MHIGIAGVGRMGANMGLRLMETGNKLTVWNRSADKVKPLAAAGAKTAASPAELASAVEAVVTLFDAIVGLLAGAERRHYRQNPNAPSAHRAIMPRAPRALPVPLP